MPPTKPTTEMHTRAKETMHLVMLKIADIGYALEEKDFKKAHDLRDKLFSYLIKEITENNRHYTKLDINEFLLTLVGIDEDWGI